MMMTTREETIVHLLSRKRVLCEKPKSEYHIATTAVLLRNINFYEFYCDDHIPAPNKHQTTITVKDKQVIKTSRDALVK